MFVNATSVWEPGPGHAQPSNLSASAALALPSPPAGLPTAQQEAPPCGLTAGSLPPSVVEVQAAGTSGSSRAGLLLVSSGRGDVSLIVRPASGDAEPPAAAGAALSAPAWPLRPLPPLQGVRPVHLAAAFELPQRAAPAAAAGESSSGEDNISNQQQQAQHSLQLCCILWAGRPRSERQPSRCEVFAVRLAATLGSPEPALTVVDVQLLKVRLGRQPRPRSMPRSTVASCCLVPCRRHPCFHPHWHADPRPRWRMTCACGHRRPGAICRCLPFLRLKRMLPIILPCPSAYVREGRSHALALPHLPTHRPAAVRPATPRRAGQPSHGRRAAGAAAQHGRCRGGGCGAAGGNAGRRTGAG